MPKKEQYIIQNSWGPISNDKGYFYLHKDLFGQLIDVQIDDAGVGYSYATITVNGDGTGAQVSSDLSPGDVNTLQANNELLTVDGPLTSVSLSFFLIILLFNYKYNEYYTYSFYI